MAQAVNTITTRQKAERIAHTDTPLAAGASFESKISLIGGFNTVTMLGISDQPFTVTVDEGCTGGCVVDSSFVRTQTFTSEVDAAGNQAICERFLPCGSYAVISLANDGGAQGLLSFCAFGIPE